MLEHADRGDAVVGLGLAERAVVGQFDADAPAQAALGDQAADMRMLVAAERDAVGAHAVVLGRPQQQRAPAGADVEKALALAQHELAADVVELGLLRLRQRQPGGAEVGARVHALRVEPQRVERIGHVVVELHLLGVQVRLVARLGERERAALAPPVPRCGAGHAGGVVADHLGGNVHEVAHAAGDVEPALDIVASDAADLAGGDVGERAQVVQVQRDRRIALAHPRATGQAQRQWQRQGIELAREQRIDDGHGLTFPPHVYAQRSGTARPLWGCRVSQVSQVSRVRRAWPPGRRPRAPRTPPRRAPGRTESPGTGGSPPPAGTRAAPRSRRLRRRSPAAARGPC